MDASVEFHARDNNLEEIDLTLYLRFKTREGYTRMAGKLEELGIKNIPHFDIERI